MAKREVTIEDYLSLLFLKRKELEGAPTQVVLDALNSTFKTLFKYRTLSLVYEPIVEFETVFEDEEDFFEENIMIGEIY